jgi:predicted NBD/HSP70 family sugar kinase
MSGMSVWIPPVVASPGDVLSLISAGRATTRAELGRVTGLSRTAVAARLAALREANLVIEDEPGPSGGGRPPARLSFNSDAGTVLAAAIGRSRTQLGVCNLAGDLLASSEIEQEVGAGPDEVMPKVATNLGFLLEQAGRSPGSVRAFGCSIPGTVDLERGASLDSPLMTGWDGVELAPYLTSLAVAPVLVDNDATVLALSERRGHLETYLDVLAIKASTGLGAGIVANGVGIRGARGAAGDIGHIKTPAAEGKACRCGDTGCLEAVAGGWALVQEMQGRGRDVGHVRHLVALAVAGDAEARRLIREAGRRLGEVLASAVNILNPEAVVVGGDMAAAYDTFVAGMRETLYAGATAAATKDLHVLPSTHGDRAGLVGCAALALDHVLAPHAIDALLAGTVRRSAAAEN